MMILTQAAVLCILLVTLSKSIRSANIPNDTSNWMSNLPEALTIIPINFLAIPGSHNSFSYTINENSKLSPDAPDFTKYLSNIKVGRNIVAKWSLTQDLTFKQQLESGIRYFDLRVAYRPETPEDPFWFCHGLYAMSVKVGLQSVKEFLDQHSQEVVLLDFNHFYELTDEHKRQLAQLLNTLFGSTKLCPLTYSLESMTLKNLWAKNQQVWIFFASNSQQELNIWSSNTVQSPWPNTPDKTTMIDYAQRKYYEGHQAYKLFVNQGILTPDTKAIVLGLLGGLRSYTDDATKRFVMWVKTKKISMKHSNNDEPIVGLNICIVDFVENYDYIRTVIGLNKV